MRLLFRTGDVNIMRVLCTRHPRPEPKRTTPLFIAAQHNQAEMVEFLLQQEKAENKRTCDMNGVTPLLIAIKEGNLEIVDMLLVESYICIDEKDNEDRNVLRYTFILNRSVSCPFSHAHTTGGPEARRTSSAVCLRTRAAFSR